MIPIIQEFIDALNSEIQELKKGKGGSSLSLYNGELQRKSGILYIYKFTLENFLITMDDTPAEIQINESIFPCNVISVVGQNVIVSLEESFGKFIPNAKLKTNTWYLLEILKKKYEECGNDANRFDRSLKVFAGEAISLSNDLLPSNYTITKEQPNESQKQAISESINKSLCIIWGPPGTGKTSTIAKLAEAHIRLGRKILLLSHANNAVDQAIIRIALQMKSTDTYQNGQLIRFGTIRPDMEEIIRNKELELVILDKIAEKKSESLVKERNQLSQELDVIKQSISNIQEIITLRNDFIKFDTEIKSMNQSIEEERITKKQCENALIEYNAYRAELVIKLEKAKTTGLFKKILLGLNTKDIQSKIDRLSIETDTKKRIVEELIHLIKNIEIKLDQTVSEKNTIRQNILNKLSQIGKTIEQIDFEYQTLSNRIGIIQSRLNEIQTAIEDVQSKLLFEAKLIGTTLTKSYVAKQIDPLKFDVVIVDEISMAPQPMLFWAISKASQSVTLVGDFKQLPPICSSQEPIAKKWLSDSLFETLHINSVDRASDDCRVSLLKEQYRMNPDISEIPRIHVYKNQIKDAPSTLKQTINDHISDSSALNIIDTTSENPWASQVTTGGRFNLYNALVAVELAEMLLNSNKENKYSISIITAYRHQATLILRIIEDKGISREKLRINTIHTFQGAEDKVVILDMVEGYGAKQWSMLNENNNADAINLLNVAITRAEAKLYLIGNLKYFKENFSTQTLVSCLFKKCEENGKIIRSSNILKNWHTTDFDKWVEKLDEIDIKESLDSSRLFASHEFWPQYIHDIKNAQNRVIILSPFLSIQRTGKLINLFLLLINKSVKIYVLTKPPNEQTGVMLGQAEIVIEKLAEIGVKIIFRSKMHQKVAIIDSELAWEGSLNILSHIDTQEQMRRIIGEKTINQIYDNLSLEEIDKENSSNIQYCPQCQSDGLKNYIIEKKGRFGQFYACSSYPKCTWTRSIDSRKSFRNPKVPTSVKSNGNNKSNKTEWETSICYWSLIKKEGYVYSKKKNAWYKKK